jgi:hypothetical protein
MYGKVQIVRSYKTTSPNAPYGYTEYEFVTASDHPNGGTYGQIDESRQRGMIKRVTQRSSTNAIIQQTTYNYQSEFREKTYSAVSNSDAMSTYGWTRLVSTDQMTDGVHSVTQYRYAPDASSSTPDAINETVTNFSVLPNTFPRSGFGRYYTPEQGRYCESATKVWGTDPAKKDIAIAGWGQWHIGGSSHHVTGVDFYLKIVADVNWSSGTNSFGSQTEFLYVTTYSVSARF